MKADKKLAVLASLAIVLAAGFLLYSNRNANPAPGGDSQGKEEVKFQNETLQQGIGVYAVKPGDKVAVNYIGTYEDDTIFASNLSEGKPFETFIAKGEAPIGWDESLLGMKIGEKRRIVVPPTYAGSGVRPEGAREGAVLYYEVEVLEIK